jgi:hypothetical protein
MMKPTIAGAMLTASLFTISAPAEACGYRHADTAKVYGWCGRRTVRRGTRFTTVWDCAGRRIVRRRRVIRQHRG